MEALETSSKTFTPGFEVGNFRTLVGTPPKLRLSPNYSKAYPRAQKPQQVMKSDLRLTGLSGPYSPPRSVGIMCVPTEGSLSYLLSPGVFAKMARELPKGDEPLQINL